MTPFNLTRGQWQAACWRMAGAEWDRWDAEATWGLSSNAYAWATRTEAEVMAERDARMAAAVALYQATPEWTPLDAAEAQLDITRGRDPRRVLALRIAVQEQEAMNAPKKRRKLPCKHCGYGVGHGHSPFCGGDDER